MKNLKVYCFLALIWLIIGSCKKHEKCQKICGCFAGSVSFGVKDAQGKDYFEQNPDLANYNDFTVYDENWNYAIRNERGDTWESLKDRILVNEHYIVYHGLYDPYGIDAKKTFYVKFKDDIDTLRLEYKVKNECFNMSYMRIYLNENEIIPTSGGGLRPEYGFRYIKK